MSEPCRRRQGKGYEVRDDEAAADVRVGVGRAVVVHVEQPVVPVLVIVPAEVQTRVGRIEVPVIRRTRKQGTDCVRRHPLYFQAAYAAENPLHFCAATPRRSLVHPTSQPSIADAMWNGRITASCAVFRFLRETER